MEQQIEQWETVNSTWLECVRYVPKLHRLDIRFMNGQATSYHGVNAKLWNEFRNAASPGAFLNRRIRGAFDAHDSDIEQLTNEKVLK